MRIIPFLLLFVSTAVDAERRMIADYLVDDCKPQQVRPADAYRQRQAQQEVEDRLQRIEDRQVWQWMQDNNRTNQ